MIRTKAELKSFLETADKPSQSQWADVVDTLFYAVDVANSITGTETPEDLVYEHHQSDPQSVWTVNHNRGVKPAIEIFDEDWNSVLTAYFHLNDNTTIIDNSQACTGYVRCFPK